MSAPRIALCGFQIECNRFAPPAGLDAFRAGWLEGPALLADARSPVHNNLGEFNGFVAAMDAAGPWQPVPLLFARAQPDGPVTAAAWAGIRDRLFAALEAAGRLDGVFCVLHGAALAEDEDDPEGVLVTGIRRRIGMAPLVVTCDLHANVSHSLAAVPDAFVGYRTNPHLDMRDRGAEAALLLRRILAGERFHVAMRRLPLVPPSVSLLTASGPYAEAIAAGQALAAREPTIANVSVMGGFAFSDSPHGGMSVVVTGTDAERAETAAEELALRIWTMRRRFTVRLTPIAEAVARAAAAEETLILADVADNPGGGGRGNTTALLAALHAAGVHGVLAGLFHDPALAEEAHALGQGARFVARLNRANPPDDPFAPPLAAEAEVLVVSDGAVTGRRGIYAGVRVDLGRRAALRLDGITLVVVSARIQCADPVFFEHLGLDPRAARVVVVKSRGHFRAGFDEVAPPERILEVDAPGLTSPVLTRFAFRRLPRPIYPLDEDASFEAA
ncbi:MAG: M81 family metallopeptidase [Acetobacteraceae bacterium]|nr:M81 family metallopeptidase [Acetobacteraceae bacterium]MCX7685938.1 M81 family metallopeptidase [Acetobacteraceae bacterium]MDW8398407.1 M81 family metallopeptidase [Acetobacteraceae bacterium]